MYTQLKNMSTYCKVRPGTSRLRTATSIVNENNQYHRNQYVANKRLN